VKFGYNPLYEICIFPQNREVSRDFVNLYWKRHQDLEMLQKLIMIQKLMMMRSSWIHELFLTKKMSAHHERSWASMSAHHEHSWVFMSHSWALMNAHECSWVLMSVHECSWVLMNVHHHENELPASRNSRKSSWASVFFFQIPWAHCHISA